MSVFDSVRRTGFRRGPSRIFGGIAGGIARQLRWNVWLVRVVILLASLLPVVGWLLYVAVWIVTPWNDGSIPLERWLGRRR
jgi:phage shock protein C